MKIFLIRHAESANNAKPLHARVADPDLTARGRLQAQALADYLSTPQADAMVQGDWITSPFRRTLHTTLILRQRIPGPFSVHADVYENGGCFTGHQPENHRGAPGMNRLQIQAILDQAGCPADIDPTIGSEGWWNQPHRETDEESDLRAAAVCQKWIQRWGDSQTSLIAILHADFIRTLLRQMLKGSADVDQLPPIKNTSITQVSWGKHGFRLVDFNATRHAPDRLVQIGVGGTQA